MQDQCVMVKLDKQPILRSNSLMPLQPYGFSSRIHWCQRESLISLNIGSGL